HEVARDFGRLAAEWACERHSQIGGPFAVNRILRAFEDRVHVVGRAQGPRCGDESSADGVARAHWESGPLGLELLEPLLLSDFEDEAPDEESEELEGLDVEAELLSVGLDSDLDSVLDSPLEPEDSPLDEAGAP